MNGRSGYHLSMYRTSPYNLFYNGGYPAGPGFFTVYFLDSFSYPGEAEQIHIGYAIAMSGLFTGVLWTIL